MPSRFSSQCTPVGECSSWRGGEDGLGTVSSGTGNSRLTASYNFVVAGSVSFFYKVPDITIHSANSFLVFSQLYSPTVGAFTFTVDSQEQLHLARGANRLGWVNVTIPVVKGVHVFEWVSYMRFIALVMFDWKKVFTSGSAANNTLSRAGAVLKDLTVIGTDYHDDACTPCSPGFKSDINSSSCTPCAIDRYSQGDSATCSVCSANTTSLAKASQCVDRTPCTDDDLVPVYSECQNNTRTLSYAYLQPQVSKDTHGQTIVNTNDSCSTVMALYQPPKQWNATPAVHQALSQTLSIQVASA